MGRLSGKAAIITGAARGIGKAIALRYAEEGCNLALCDLNLDGVQATAVSARKKGVDANVTQTDVTSRKQLQAMVDGAIAQFGTVEVLVNNAGIFFNAAFDQMTDEQWDRMMDVNLKSVFILSQIVIRHWLEHEIRGVIVNLASISAAIAFTNSSAYCSAKAAVASMTRCIALEYGPRGIRANSMAPGIINTGMPNADQVAQWVNTRIPVRKLGEPEDVADLALFLASDESRYVTGDMIFVDGGWMLE
jgi:NAD(P)-dependent dehydrogenase (short-subunit alcohol dehydrogenase family)